MDQEQNTNSGGGQRSRVSAILTAGAFLAAMAVFVAIVLLCNRYIPRLGAYEHLRPLLSFACAAAATMAILYTIKMISQGEGKNK